MKLTPKDKQETATADSMHSLDRRRVIRMPAGHPQDKPTAPQLSVGDNTFKTYFTIAYKNYCSFLAQGRLAAPIDYVADKALLPLG